MATKGVSEAKYACKSCDIRDEIERMFSCDQCDLTPICGHCAMKNHKDHQCTGIKELQEKFGDWRQSTKSKFDEIHTDSDEISDDIVNARASCRYISQALDSFEAALGRINRDKEAVDADIKTSNVCDLAVSGQKLDKRLNDMSSKMNSLAYKQKFLKINSRSISEILRNGNKLMKDVLSRVSQGYELVEETNQHNDGAAAAGGRRAQLGNIFVANLHESTTEEALYDLFSQFGRITSVKVMKDDSELCNGNAYVQFEKEEDAQAAIKRAGGKLSFKGYIISVFEALSKEERQQRGIGRKVPGATVAPQDTEPKPQSRGGAQPR